MNLVFRALSDPTRRQILALLRDSPRSSGEIADAFPVSWPTISRHLSVLREAGLIIAVRAGQFIHYEINTTVLEDLIQNLFGLVQKKCGEGDAPHDP